MLVRTLLALVIASGLAGRVARAAGGAPPVFDWQPQPARARTVPRPLCFAYAASLRAYACIGYVDVRPTHHRRQMVDVVGLDRGRPIVRSHGLPKPEIDRWLSRLGFAPAALRGERLVPGQWIAAGGARFRYDLRPHEGDASFENHGDVTLRCPAGDREIPLGVRERNLELGEVAWTFWQPGTDVIAISVAGEDGGEDTFDNWVNTLVVDVRALCAGNGAAIAGPLPGRSS